MSVGLFVCAMLEGVVDVAEAPALETMEEGGGVLHGRALEQLHG